MITPRQRDVLMFVDGYEREFGFGPSYMQIQEGVGLKSKSGVNRLLNELQDRGFVKMHPGRSRSIEVLKLPPDCDHLPAGKERDLEGRVAVLEQVVSALCRQRRDEAREGGPRPIGDIASELVLDMQARRS